MLCVFMCNKFSLQKSRAYSVILFRCVYVPSGCLSGDSLGSSGCLQLLRLLLCHDRASFLACFVHISISRMYPDFTFVGTRYSLTRLDSLASGYRDRLPPGSFGLAVWKVGERRPRCLACGADFLPRAFGDHASAQRRRRCKRTGRDHAERAPAPVEVMPIRLRCSPARSTYYQGGHALRSSQ